MTCTNFDDLRELANRATSVRLSVAGGDDPRVLEAVEIALKDGLVSEVFISGDPNAIRVGLDAELQDAVEVLPASSAAECAALAVSVIRDGEADVLMKGRVDSASYLRAIVDRDTGIRQSSVLSNVTVAEMPSYPKFLAATDNGIVPAPDLDQKRQIIKNTKALYRGFGIETVKVAALAATEKPTEAIPATVDAATLSQESRDGKFPGFVIDGPFAYDVAISSKAARIKGLESSPVAGETDLILFSNIEAANSVAKAWKLHGQAKTGSLVLGASAPVLLNSRSDDAERRIYGLLLAIAAKAGAGAGQ